jgi:hypothetical protein
MNMNPWPELIFWGHAYLRFSKGNKFDNSLREEATLITIFTAGHMKQQEMRISVATY